MATSTDDLFDALERIASIKGKGAQAAKLAILKEQREHVEWLRRAVEPTISYYVATLPKYDKHGTETLNEGDLTLLNRLASREVSGNEALQRIEDTMRELTPKSQQVLRRVLLKDLRCGVGATLMNTVWPGIVRDFPYMRCSLPKDSNEGEPGWWEGGVYVQLKADGMFANVDSTDEGIAIYSRQGTLFPLGPLGFLEEVLTHQLKPGTQTHGELTVYENGDLLERAVGNGILNSLAQGGKLEKNQHVRFDAWDQIPLGAAVPKGKYDVPYAQRFNALAAQLNDDDGGDPRYARCIETFIVYSRTDALSHYRRYLGEGLEGVICKAAHTTWKDGDSKDQVKLKLEVPVDLQVEAILPGNADTKNEGRAGRLTMASADGLLRVNVTVKNEAMRDLLDKSPESFLGKIMVVCANGVMNPSDSNELHSLFLPRFVEAQPRIDKSEADSLERVQAQFEAAVAA